MQLYMTAAPEQYRLLSGMPFRLSHLAYQIGTDGHLHRATVSRQMQSGLLALNDAMPPAISDPTALSREILRECMSRGYEGVAADFGGSTTPDRMVFLEEAAKLLHRNSKKLFLSAAYGRRIPTAYVLVNTAISGGTLRTMLVDACNAFGRGRVALDIERLRMDFLLPSPTGEGTPLTKESFDYKQHFTQPPAHYTEASLVKTLEELGIGRPSTYAPTISTIITRRYVAKENKNLYMTELGEVVNNIMKQSFASIVDVNFTAYMEGLLDMIAEGKVEWKSVISNFYPDLKEAVEKAEKELETVKIEDEVTDVVCEECGRNMVIKYGPHGKFLACPGFPECRNTKPYLEKIGVACPKCGKDIVLRKTKKGRRYYGCEDNPECDFMSWQKPSEEKCPKCGSYMVEKGNKLVCGNEQCGFVKNKEKDEK